MLPPHVRQSQHFVTHLRLICIIIKQWKFITLPDSWSRNSLKEESRRSFIQHKEFVFGYWNLLHSCRNRTTDPFAACVRCWGFRFCLMDHLCFERRNTPVDSLCSVSVQSRLLYIHMTNQQMQIYKYVQLHVIIFHHVLKRIWTYNLRYFITTKFTTNYQV